MLKLTQVLALSTIVAALASAAPAIASPYSGAHPGMSYVTEDGDRLAPRREGPTGLVIRRDGASAVPFAPAAVSPPVQADDRAGDGGFDLGDAAVGAGAGIVACLLAVGGVALVAFRRPSTARTLTS
jgi:hypothetical protein